MEDLKKSFGAMSELEQALYIGGGKEYVFDGYGKLLETKENDLDYNMVVRGSAYHIIHNELTFSSYYISWKNEDGTYSQGVCTQIEGGDFDMFKFLASNTSVEWGGMVNGGKNVAGSNPCTMITCNDRGTVAGVLQDGYDTYIHSHPHGGSPSHTDNDEDERQEMKDAGYDYQGTYTPGHGIEWY